ncbi:MAG: SurA N-terminal domain-containing protein [Candidatus Saccharimonadales bacterium]
MKRKRINLKPAIKLPKVPFRKSRDVENDDLPRITNDTVAAHREEVLSSARKYIYPLQHSKHRVVKISVSLLIAAIIGFFVYFGLALYKFQSTSGFVYAVTQVIPFPVAKAGSSYVSYNSYLFELRHYIHYYQTQQQVDFSSKSGKEQLAEFKKRSMNKVLQVAYAKQLAKEHGVSVSNKEVDNEIALVRSQNRLGGSDQVFRDVLNEFWGWSVTDFRRELRDELLEQKVVTTMDTKTHDKANDAYAALQSGADFGETAKKYSEDVSTAPAGGVYPISIDRTNRDIAPQLVSALFVLNQNEYSPIINTGYRLEIVKVTQITGDKVQAAHIAVNFKDISYYTDQQQTNTKPRRFISV